MLKKLSVVNVAVVERAEVLFGPTLNVVTGETGAGKSVLMGALELVLGARADSSIVRDGAREAEVEADFGCCVIRRTVTAEGRSRAWLNDESIALSELRSHARRLVDIHGPRSNQNILDESFQREALDRCGKIVLDGYSAAYDAMCSVRERIAQLDNGVADDEMDLLRFQIGELEAVGLSPEDEDLAERHASAAHAGEIVEIANAMTESLGGDCGVSDQLSKLQSNISAVARHLPAAEGWAAEAEELAVKVQELSRSIADTVSKIDADPEAFEELDRRYSALSRLRRKYLKGAQREGEGDVARLMALLEDKKARLDEFENREVRLGELKAQLAAARKTVEERGAELTAARAAAAKRLSKAVTAQLRDLGFRQAGFTVRIESTEPEAHGCDRVVYMFEPNPGESARALADIASSGEIARVMLALKTVLASVDDTQLLVFDEIDANVGGEAARTVG
jgi:DNA repair protein RecN (Recombination protein N)